MFRLSAPPSVKSNPPRDSFDILETNPWVDWYCRTPLGAAGDHVGLTLRI
jgi:hypothetical protein